MTQTQVRRSENSSLCKGKRGFTIIELLIVLVIVAIFATIAIPSMMGAIQSNRLTTQGNDFLGSLYYARSEAIKLGTGVVVCASSTGTSCDGVSGDWSAGWIVWYDENADGAVANTTTEILRVAGGLDAENTMIEATPAPDLVTSVTFSSRGLSDTQASWVLCDNRGADEARSVVLSMSGRAKIADTLASGGALTCP